MTRLVVCLSPGEELHTFGNLILAGPPNSFDVVAAFAHPSHPAWDKGQAVLAAACADLGVRQARLLPFAQLDSDRIDPALLQEQLGPLDGYERVYTHSVQASSALAQRLGAAVGALREEVWTTAGGGRVDEVISVDDATFRRRLELLATHYPDLLMEGRIAARDLRTVDLFQCQRGPDLCRYVRGYLDWQVNVFDYRSPWELESSDYERRRYDAELDALTLFPWDSLVEVAACEGAFTERLCERFPGRRITAYEPDRRFFATLRQRMGSRAILRQGDAEAAGGEPCDVLFISSAIYYFGRMPYRMLERARFVVTSHAKPYTGGLDAILAATGFTSEFERDVGPCIEPMEGILEVKYGTHIEVWRRREELS